MAKQGMSRGELLALPVSMDLVTAGRALGLGRTTAHAMARTNTFPVRVLRLGNKYRVTRADLFRALGEQDIGSPERDALAPGGAA